MSAEPFMPVPGAIEQRPMLWTILEPCAAPAHLFGKTSKQVFVKCRCACGTEAIHPRRYIERRQSLSCGCASRPKLRNAHAAFVRALQKSKGKGV